MGDTQPRRCGARIYAATCLSVAALVAAAPAELRGDELLAVAEQDSAQVRPQPWLSVAPVVEVESPGEADYRISIGPAENLSSGASVRIRGLPTAAVLSAGQSSTEKTGERVWVVPLAATPGLKLQVPRGVVAISRLLVTLVDSDGRVLAEQTSKLLVRLQITFAPMSTMRVVPVDSAVSPPPSETAVAAAPPERVGPPRENILVPSPSQKVPLAPPDQATSPQRKPDETIVAAPPPQRGVAPPPDKVVVPSPSQKAPVPPLSPVTSQQRKPGETTTSALTSTRPALSSRASPAPPAATCGPPDARPARSSEDLAQAGRLVAKGEGYMARGDIAVARRYFERAVDLGLAIAALRMAETHDPRELARWGVLGVKGDLEEARRWYLRALDLEVPEAESRLRRLGSQ
jgi:hypothetical protein